MKTKQIEEWTENPVTLYLLDLVKKEVDKIQDTPMGDCLVKGDPFRSHENLVELEARGQAWQTMVEFLAGDLDYFTEEEE